jgi:hypothetical protein
MSKDTVMKFFDAIRSDEAIVERLRAISKDVDAFARLSVDLGRERGFAFEPSDVREALDALVRKAEGELSDRDLAAVAGGGGCEHTVTHKGTQAWAIYVANPSRFG